MLFSLASFEGRARFGPVVVEELVVAPRFFGGCLRSSELRCCDEGFVSWFGLPLRGVTESRSELALKDGVVS